jgi:hypothetical protein
MSDLRTAAQQALEALEAIDEDPHATHSFPALSNDAITALRAALEQPEPDYYLLPTNRKEPRPGLVNLEEFPGFIYESPNGWHIGDMKVVKWLLNNREADYWEQFKEKP